MVNSEEFQYPLPEEAIATEPVHPRRAAKMLVRTGEGEVSTRLRRCLFASA